MNSKSVTRVMMSALFIAGAQVALAADKPSSLSPQARVEIDKAITRGLVFLQSNQLEDGGWRGFDGSDPAITAMVAKCFAQHPDYGPTHPLVERAYGLILRYVQPDGGIYNPELGLKNYYTSVAVMALSLSDKPEARDAVRGAQRFLSQLQWDEGEDYASSHVFYGGAGYGRHQRPDLSNTQMMLEALHQSGLKPEHPVYKKALVFISRCQMLPETNDQPFAKHGDGGFIYSPVNGGESKAGEDTVDGHTRLRSYGSMTYSGYKSLLYAGLKTGDPRVRAAKAWIAKHYTLEANPNMPGKQSKQGLYYYYHVFARALDAAGEESIAGPDGTRHLWRSDLSRTLISAQRTDGSWVNEADRWYESNPHLVTAYSILALQTCLN